MTKSCTQSRARSKRSPCDHSDRYSSDSMKRNLLTSLSLTSSRSWAADCSWSPLSMHSLNMLPPVLVVSATSPDAHHRLRSATMACRRAERGAVAFSVHWGPSEILVETAHGASLDLVARATQLLRTAGLPAVAPQRLDVDAQRQPPLIRVSIPAHFGVELMLLAGAVLRPLHDRQLMFIGLCGTIDAGLQDRFDSSSLDDLKRYANQLPKHRMADLYPLFCLIGAWSGVARGLLNHVFSEKTAGPYTSRSRGARNGRRSAGTSLKRRHG